PRPRIARHRPNPLGLPGGWPARIAGLLRFTSRKRTGAPESDQPAAPARASTDGRPPGYRPATTAVAKWLVLAPGGVEWFAGPTRREARRLLRAELPSAQASPGSRARANAPQRCSAFPGPREHPPPSPSTSP